MSQIMIVMATRYITLLAGDIHDDVNVHRNF